MLNILISFKMLGTTTYATGLKVWPILFSLLSPAWQNICTNTRSVREKHCLTAEPCVSTYSLTKSCTEMR